MKQAAAALALGVLAAGAADAQSVGHILSQPARDVGIDKKRIPPVLLAASDAPYAMTGVATCAAIGSAIAALTAAVGPDFTGSPAANHRNLAKLGGAAVVNSLIPFRGLVRQVSGADAAQQHYAAAVAAGVARRGFLHGLASAKGCRA